MRLLVSWVCLLGALWVPWGAGSAATRPLPAEVRKEVHLAGPVPTVLEQLGKLYGVKVRVDEELRARKVELRLEEVDFSSALRVAARLTETFWVVQPDGAVLVAADTPDNRARYEPRVTKTFFLPGRTPDELTEVVRLLREILDMRTIRSDPESNSFTVQDTPPRVAVAEKLLEQVSAAPGEVWVDVLLLEVDREEAQRLGVLPPDQVVAVHLGAGALAAGRDNLQSLLENLLFLRDLGVLPEAALQGVRFDPQQMRVVLPPFVVLGGGGTAYAALLPGAELSLSHLARVTRSMRRFSLRAREDQEATFFAGELFPVVLATFSSSFISPLEQVLRAQGRFIPPVPAVRYEELGLRVTVRPRMHPGGELTLTLKLDQKALTGREFNGIPVLTSLSLSHQTRLREGEALLLSGLRNRSVARTATGLPLLGSVPVIGHLFRQTAPSTEETELLVLLTPRVVRPPLPERVALAPLYVGRESEFSPAGPPSAPEQEPRPAQPAPEEPEE